MYYYENSNSLDNQVITKAYVDQFDRERERSRRDLDLDFWIESIAFVKNNQDTISNADNFFNLDSITINRNPSSENEFISRKSLYVELNKETILRFIQSLESCLKKSVGDDVYNLAKYNKILITDKTFIKTGMSGKYLLPYQKTFWNDRNNNRKIQNFFQ